MEDRKHYWEDVCIPRNEFIKEHVHLLKLLKHGDRTQLLAEAKSQEAELQRETMKGGSRAAGYIKKLIAMYKDGLELFDIKKMKWASDNLKAFGISMEEDEGPVGADDYSEYSPKEADVHRKLNALAKKADREGNTAEIKAEYKQLRAELKAEEPKEHPAITAYKNALEEQERNSSGMRIGRLNFALTKAENEEMKQLEMQMKEKARSVKTQDEIRAFNKEQSKVLDKFKDRVKKRHNDEEDNLRKLKKASDEAKGIKPKPIEISEGKSFSFGTGDSTDILSGFYNRSKPAPAPAKIAEKEKEDKPDWRKAAGYEDPVVDKYGVIQNAFNVNSQLPSDYKPDDGWDWLASKYGKLYDLAVEKTKEVVRKGRASWTDKEFKNYIRLPFDDATQMKDFFRDVLLADPIIYNFLHINAFSTKAPATTNALREFKKWIGK